MAAAQEDVLMIGPARPVIAQGLASAFNVLDLPSDTQGKKDFFSKSGRSLRAIATSISSRRIDSELMEQLPRLEIISSFGVGYDHVDAAWAGAHGIIVTNTPDVLTEEVADTALGLLLCTVRELPQAERHLRAGKWANGDYPLSKASLRTSTVGLVGMGRIARSIARRLDAVRVPVVYHARKPAQDVPYRHYPNLVEMAREVNILLVIVPGGAGTRNMIDDNVLAALGPEGILINMARGSVVDERALIDALKNKTIMSAGLDVYADEPNVPQELVALPNVVLFPHVGSASVATRAKMDQLVVDNLLAWKAGKPPLTPVPETPWPPPHARRNQGGS
ncbi:MAG: 2-hydroxyacid dehydrogenase [Xanthobacteraceae bacterium]